MAKKKKQELTDTKKEFRTYQFNISKGDTVFSYCDDICFKSKNMYNVANFYIRQIMTGVQKEKVCLSQNEKEVFSIVKESLISMNQTKEQISPMSK